jgi:hypothetical protein
MVDLDPERMFRFSCIIDEADKELELWCSRRERIGCLKAMVVILQNKIALLERGEE